MCQGPMAALQPLQRAARGPSSTRRKAATLLLALIAVALLCNLRLPLSSALEHSANHRDYFLHHPKAERTVKESLDIIANHQFVFVVGAHHSGTTLLDYILGEHDDASRLEKTGSPQNEGQHLQNVYANANDLGGLLSYVYKKEGILRQDSPLLTDENRQEIFESWAPFWDLDRTYLVEKSPRHSIMTRFFQELFGRDRTQFVLILRHPLGSWNWLVSTRPTFKSDCGARFVEQWLYLHEILLEDAKHLKSFQAFQYEHLVGVSSRVLQGTVDQAFDKLGLKGSVKVQHDNRNSTFNLESLYRALRRRQPHCFNADGYFQKACVHQSRLPDQFRPDPYNPSKYPPVRSSDLPAKEQSSTKRSGTSSSSSSPRRNRNRSSGRGRKVVGSDTTTRLSEEWQRYHAYEHQVMEWKQALEEAQASGSSTSSEISKLEGKVRGYQLMCKNVLNKWTDEGYTYTEVAKLTGNFVNLDHVAPDGDSPGDKANRRRNPQAVRAKATDLQRTNSSRSSGEAWKEKPTAIATSTEPSSSPVPLLGSARPQQLEHHRGTEKQPLPPRALRRPDEAEAEDPDATALRRQLLEYWGSANEVVVHAGGVFDWISTWDDVDFGTDACLATIDKYESRLNEYGYSLIDLHMVETPTILKDYLTGYDIDNSYDDDDGDDAGDYDDDGGDSDDYDDDDGNY